MNELSVWAAQERDQTLCVIKDHLGRRVEERARTDMDTYTLVMGSLQITHERVRDELAKLAFANMGDYMDIDPGGKPHLNWSKLTKDQKAALSEASVDEVKTGDPKAPPVIRTRFKLADKRAALMDLAKLCGLIRDDDGKDDTNVQIAKIERVIVHHEPRKEDMDDSARFIDNV